MYRLPDEKRFYSLSCADEDVLRLHSISGLSGKEGFVMSPFQITEADPLLLFGGEFKCEPLTSGAANAKFPRLNFNRFQDEKRAYKRDFSIFHEHLVDKTFSKIVLKRCSEAVFQGRLDVKALFQKACLDYPHTFVAFVSSPFCGTWLTATPEVLLSQTGNVWHTMALAGTMAADDNKAWSRKNIEEQRYVSRYIASVLRPLSSELSESPTQEKCAGGVKHLCSEFNFSLHEGCDTAHLLSLLYPTPAVCGIPKDATQQFIIRSESQPRRYYSGFMGNVSHTSNTELFVNLRCIEIANEMCRFYAGGGLLEASAMDDEWQETQRKMQTILRLFED